MISWTKLLTGRLSDYENTSYSKERNLSPKVVVWNITSRCNLHCLHCYSDALSLNDPDELSKVEAIDFIKDLSRIKIKALIFSGGEPLLRRDIFSIAKFAKDNGVRVALSTNGTLIDQRTAKKIKDAGFYYVGISLDGMQKTHDAFRLTEGSFQSSIAAMRNCQNEGLKVGLRFTLTKYNFTDLLDLFDFVKRESISRFCIYHLVYAGRANTIKEMDLSHEERRQVLELIWQEAVEFVQGGLNIEVLTVDNHADGAWIYLKLRKVDPRRAQAVLQILEAQEGNSSGIKIAAISNSGEIYADQFLRSHPLGNIRKKSLSELWQDEAPPFLQALRNRRQFLKGRCQGCRFLAICNGNFRARAQASSGDLWAEDPSCYLNEEERYGDGSAIDILGDNTRLQSQMPAL